MKGFRTLLVRNPFFLVAYQVEPKMINMKYRSLVLFTFLLPTIAFAQLDKLSGNVSGMVNLPIVADVAPDLDGETHRAQFGWPEAEANLYYSLLESGMSSGSMLELYAGGTYRNMFGIEELADGRDFEGDMTMQQVRVGARILNLLTLAYVRNGIRATGTSEGLFSTFEYGGSTVWQDGYQIGVEASRDVNTVGLYFQSSLAGPEDINEPEVQWSILEARVRSELLKGDNASGFVQLNFGYDVIGYDSRESSDNVPIEYEGFRIGLGIGVSF